MQWAQMKGHVDVAKVDHSHKCFVLRDLSLCKQAIEAASKKRSATQHTSSPGASITKAKEGSSDCSLLMELEVSNDFLQFKEQLAQR